MLSAIPLYAGVLWLLAPAAGTGTSPGKSLPWVLLAVGLGEYAAASVFGAGLLRAAGGRSGASERVRRFFLVRFAAAEAIALFGLVVGLKGAPPSRAAVLFGVSALVLIAAAPTRGSWEKAAAATRRIA
jgi:F0F1-type ATP synthase membrane subunit c/vacuolar-type H+-ATPase subunit K